MRLDDEDRAFLARVAVIAVAAVVAVLGSAGLLGLAIRVFELAAG